MRIRPALLLAWALVATVLAALWAPREAPHLSRAPAGITSLKRRIAELEDALAAGVPPPLAPPDGGAAGVEGLFEDVCRVARDPDATITALQDADRALHALLARDAGSHAALARMLPLADEETADLLLAALVHNPFVKAARRGDVTEEVLAIAASCLRAQEPHIRAAGATLLLGYASPPEPPHVRLAVNALAAEGVPSVRDGILAAVVERALGAALTEADARPIVAGLRERVDAGGTEWLSALADWSGAEEDYGRAEALFRAQADTVARQESLNAFRREGRLVEGRVERAEALLREVMLDPALDDLARGVARLLLDGYAPWGTETAEAVRRYDEDPAAR